MSTEGCRICTTIGEAITDAKDGLDEVNVGTYGELLDNAENCQTCRSIISGCSRDYSEVLELEASIFLYNHVLPESDLQISDEGQTALFLEIAELSPRNPTWSSAIMVNRQWIDLQRLRSWLRFCDKSHQNTCHGFPKQNIIQPADSLLLIDVIEERLVSAPGTARYLALSYVWGKDTGDVVLETTLENIHEHMQNGCLSLQKSDLRLPDTIKDSMRLVKQLDERYLWVDRLCIIQNSAEHKTQQIGMMGSIYAHSYCTLIAAGGNDSHYGLRGVGDGSKPRQIHQYNLEFPGAPCLILKNALRDEKSSFWNTRGWTYQEKIMSRRALVFTSDTVIWRCQHSIWREDMTGDADGVARRQADNASYDLFVPSSWPSFFQWMFLIQKYNRRDLSFESDRLAAIAGIESALSVSFVDGFCYGLPRFFFDAALLWQPNSPMQRRIGGDPSDMKTYLPSWSWLGWHGTLSAKSAFMGFDYVRTNPPELSGGSTSCITSPLVEWHVVDRTGGQQKIGNDYHTWRQMVNLSIQELPSGWSKHQGEEGTRPFFSHSSAEPATFWWPVPMSPISIHSKLQLSSPHITFKSSRAYFIIDQRIPSLDLCQCMVVSLRDAKGGWAGILRLNTASSDTVPTGEIVELVAISTGRCENLGDESRFFEEWRLEERPRSDLYYEFYNVLHVEREDGWILRQSLGRVQKGVWDCQQLEECQFKLR